MRKRKIVQRSKNQKKKNSVERAQGTKTINEAKESMDKKVKEYEQKLRKNKFRIKYKFIKFNNLILIT